MIETMSRQAGDWRRRVLRALSDLEYHAPTEADTMDYQFARRLVNALLEGWQDPYVVACYYTYGLHPDKLIPALAARRALQTWELYRENVDEATQERRPQTATRNLYPMPPAKKSTKQKPLSTVPRHPAKTHVG